MIASAPREVQERFLDELTEGALLALPYLFEFWAMAHQLPPEGDWRSWVVMGGRGAGKTRAGAEWLRGQVEGSLPLSPGRASRVALVGETLDQAREVMIFGDSGIMACSPADRRPVWEAGRKRLVWPNGAVAQVFSAHDPESRAGRSSTPRGWMSWPSGSVRERPGTCCNSPCGWATIRGRW
ncbi:hypothetical protein SAMN04490244_104117 [Tranquillimonas rosea]|uniref:Uncharacterized protein n=1 Tax=Tranquillimonas rosea TaxID=641238 RepID=A0A1H9TDF1_9RHOB|nr:hypothetical protein SAMN04490244_104117 [Tranquillimonas rosea]